MRLAATKIKFNVFLFKGKNFLRSHFVGFSLALRLIAAESFVNEIIARKWADVEGILQVLCHANCKDEREKSFLDVFQ